MKTTVWRTAFAHGRAAVRLAFISLPLWLAGCSYIDAMLARTASPDTRIVLDWQERRQLSAREIPRYTCPTRFLLTCDRGGAATYSCTCQAW